MKNHALKIESKKNSEVILKHFVEVPEIKELLETQSTNTHVISLLEMLQKAETTIKSLFAYGLHNLPKDAERPDPTLSIYFYLVSELRELSPTLRDFALDLMVYAENSSDFPTETYDNLNLRFRSLF